MTRDEFERELLSIQLNNSGRNSHIEQVALLLFDTFSEQRKIREAQEPGSVLSFRTDDA